MAFVLDASITASWGLADETSAVADTAKFQLLSESALVPRIWWYEVRNLLLTNERRRRITENELTGFLKDLSSLPILTDPGEEDGLIFLLARQYRLTFYDAAYLALAMRERVPLATLDKALQTAAVSAGIPLLA